MAKKKTPDDLAWEKIFASISFDIEPPVKYIKEVLVKTKNGRKVMLSGREFVSVIEQERHMDPSETMIQSCRITLDFEKIKNDTEKFASALLKRSSRRFRKSRSQRALELKLKKLQAVQSNIDTSKS